jgi:hypothetical protein
MNTDPKEESISLHGVVSLFLGPRKWVLLYEPEATDDETAYCVMTSGGMTTDDARNWLENAARRTREQDPNWQIP